MSRLVLLTSEHIQAELLAGASRFAPDFEPFICLTRTDLIAEAESVAQGDYLLSFCSGVIVPEAVLDKFDGRALNVHPGAPDYPGRDPHHFAVFDRALRYGATLHQMTARVDAGTIYDAQLFDVPEGIAPGELMQRAEQAGLKLVYSAMRRIAHGEGFTANQMEWGTVKTSRNDFQRLCRISPVAPVEDFERRMSAVHHSRYNNAFVTLHGRVFRDTGEQYEPVRASTAHDWDDFTTASYRKVLQLAKTRYQFAAFGDRPVEPHVLWRHDIDHSPHRALRLGEIEAEEGVFSTHFFWIRSPYYNVLEPSIRYIAQRLAELGHRIGLHFDIQGYSDPDWTAEKLDARIQSEAAFLESEFGCPVKTVSFHDPENGGMLRFGADQLGGLHNAYSDRLRADYGYCSDSNGYWRFTPIPEVIAHGDHERLHVLTHPVWWTEEAMAPREKIERAILGRAQATLGEYDDHLRRSGRQNRS